MVASAPGLIGRYCHLIVGYGPLPPCGPVTRLISQIIARHNHLHLGRLCRALVTARTRLTAQESTLNMAEMGGVEIVNIEIDSISIRRKKGIVCETETVHI